MGMARTFDYDEAKARYESGERVVDLAAEYGVSVSAMYRAINPEIRRRMDAYASAYQMQGKCIDCGAAVSLYQTGKSGRVEKRCVSCAAKARATSVRSDELFCANCSTWKPDAEFPFSRAARNQRRGRHQSCRECNTALRRAYRERNKVPCKNCGQPRLPANENGSRHRGTNDSGLCKPCFVESLRKVAA